MKASVTYEDETLILGQYHINGLVQDCSISSALAMEILQSYSKQSFILF